MLSILLKTFNISARKHEALQSAFVPALSLLLSYAAWIWIVRIILLTLITYFLSASNSNFQEISDSFGSNEVPFMGIAALTFTAIFHRLKPTSLSRAADLFSQRQIEKEFSSGFMQGTVLATGVTVAFLLTGTYRYLGFFMQPDDAPIAFANILLRGFTLAALIYCEEYIFRLRVLNYFRSHFSDLFSIFLTTLAYISIKALQFDLSIMHLITLALVSLVLSLRAILDGDFGRGAGFWAGILLVFHPLLSLPVLGNDFPGGVLLIKYQGITSVSQDLATYSAPVLNFDDADSLTTRLISGGVGGPLSSIALQLLLGFLFARELLHRYLKGRKILSRTPFRWLR